MFFSALKKGFAHGSALVLDDELAGLVKPVEALHDAALECTALNDIDE